MSVRICCKSCSFYHLSRLLIKEIFSFLHFQENVKNKKNLKKILKQVEYESARRKRHVNEKTRKRDEEGSTFLLCTFISFYFVYFVENGSKKLIFRKVPKAFLRDIQGNSREPGFIIGKRS